MNSPGTNCYVLLCVTMIVSQKIYMRVFLFSILLMFTIPVVAQNLQKFDAGKQPYFLVDSFQTDVKLLLLSADKIESVTVLKDSNAIAAYGEKGRNGVVVVKTKPNTKLLRIGDLLDKYKIPKADRTLRVCINKTVVSRPDLILAEESEILGLEITSDRHWINPENADSKEKFINIKTVKIQ